MVLVCSALKVKARSRLVCPLQAETRAQLPVLLQPGPRTQLASLHLGWTHLPSAEPLGSRGRADDFAEPRFKVGAGCACGQAPVFVSSILGRPYGSCPALNPSTSTACKVNCSTTQCFTSAIYISPVTMWVIRASAAWWCSLRPADFPFNDIVLFNASDRISFCLRSHYALAEFGMLYPKKTRKALYDPETE